MPKQPVFHICEKNSSLLKICPYLKIPVYSLLQLMLALPHHLDAMDQDKIRLALPNSYQTIKGKMTGVVGSAWEMTLPLTNITWTSSKVITKTKLIT